MKMLLLERLRPHLPEEPLRHDRRQEDRGRSFARCTVSA